MTFSFKCEQCNALLLLIVKSVSEVSEKLNDEGWKISHPDRTYFAWTDTIPAKCPTHKSE